MILRNGFCSKLMRTMKTLHLSPTSCRRRPSALPHWPAPVSVVIVLMPELLVVPRLRNGGVGLVAAGRRNAFVLVVDLCRRSERLFQVYGAAQRRRSPAVQDLRISSGMSIQRLCADFLLDEVHGKHRRQPSGGRVCRRGRGAAASVKEDREPGCTIGAEFRFRQAISLPAPEET